MILVLALRVPASSHMLGAGVRIVASAPGELHVSQGDAVLSARRLTPGGRPARGSLSMTNVTREAVEVRFRATGSGAELDRGLHVELRSGSRRLASGPLAELRDWSRPVRVERGGEETVRARAWIAPGATRTAGRHVALDLELDANLAKTSNR